jgi:hypothetical protein
LFVIDQHEVMQYEDKPLLANLPAPDPSPLLALNFTGQRALVSSSN